MTSQAQAMEISKEDKKARRKAKKQHRKARMKKYKSKLRNLREHIEKLAHSLTCSICTDYLVIPHALACGHCFCYTCIHRWFSCSGKEEEDYRMGVKCPICRAAVEDLPVKVHVLEDQLNLLMSARKKRFRKLYEERLATCLEFYRRETGKDDWQRVIVGKAILDKDDNVMRCPDCLRELEAGTCPECMCVYDVEADAGESLEDMEEFSEEEEEEGSVADSFIDDEIRYESSDSEDATEREAGLPQFDTEQEELDDLNDTEEMLDETEDEEEEAPSTPRKRNRAIVTSDSE